MVIIVAMKLSFQNLRITPEMLTLIAELDEFKGAWRALSTLAPERLAAMRKVATIESIGEIVRATGQSRSTIKLRLADLLRKQNSAPPWKRKIDLVYASMTPQPKPYRGLRGFARI